MKRFAIALLLPLLVGCGSEAGYDYQDNPEISPKEYTILIDGSSDAFVQDFVLPDGTRCLTNSNKGGITCDFDSPMPTGP